MDRRKPKKDKNDNPFSFRNFLTTPNTNETSSNSSLNRQTETSNNNVFNNRRRDPSDRTTNPYSFARFIQNPESSRPIQCVRGDNCMIVQGELPDFVQDHFSSSNGLNNDHSQRNGLPDFTHHTTMDNNSTSNNLPFYNQRSEFHLSSSEEELINTAPLNDLPRLAVSTSANLPDFLSDTGINIVNIDNEPPMPTMNELLSVSNGSHQSNGPISEPADDVVLSGRIVELEEELSQKNLRIRQLEQQLSDQKRKEEEETEIMESMMRQVDENLNRAVERWQNSEREIERLNIRINQLEIQLTRGSEGHQTPMHIVRHIGAQLGSDLMVADELIKSLLTHSDKLKLLAGHLQYLDRVEEDISNPSDESRTHAT